MIPPSIISLHLDGQNYESKAFSKDRLTNLIFYNIKLLIIVHIQDKDIQHFAKILAIFEAIRALYIHSTQPIDNTRLFSYTPNWRHLKALQIDALLLNALINTTIDELMNHFISLETLEINVIINEYISPPIKPKVNIKNIKIVVSISIHVWDLSQFVRFFVVCKNIILISRNTNFLTETIFNPQQHPTGQNWNELSFTNIIVSLNILARLLNMTEMINRLNFIDVHVILECRVPPVDPAPNILHIALLTMQGAIDLILLHFVCTRAKI